MTITQTQFVTKNRPHIHYSISLYRLVGIFSILFSHFLWLSIANADPQVDRWLTFGQLLSEPRCGCMVLSGFLYSQKVVSDVKGFYVKNYKKLLIPLLEVFAFLLVWNLITMAVTHQNFFSLWQGEVWSSNIWTGSKWVKETVLSFSNWYYVAWVVVAYLFVPFLARWNESKLAKGVVIGSVVLNFAVVCFWMPSIKLLYPCFVLGWFVGKKRFSDYFDISKKKSLDITIWTVVTVFAVGIFTYANFLSAWDNSNFFKMPSYMPPRFIRDLLLTVTGAAFGTSTLFLFLIFTNSFMYKLEYSRFFKMTDKWTYYIYLMNQCFACGGTDTRNWVPTTGLRCIVFTAMTIAGSLFVYYADECGKKIIKKIKAKKVVNQNSL